MIARCLTLALTIAALNAGCASPQEEETLDTKTAALEGVTLDGLRDAGWVCAPRGGGAFIVCGAPGLGIPPIPGQGEEGRPAYYLVTFFPDGTLRGGTHFIRADLYQGQTCSATGQPYILLGIVGYYECLTLA